MRIAVENVEAEVNILSTHIKCRNMKILESHSNKKADSSWKSVENGSSIEMTSWP